MPLDQPDTLFDNPSQFSNWEQLARIRTGQFQTTPPGISAFAEYALGVFGTLSSDNKFVKATSSDVAVTHYLYANEVPNLLASEIAAYHNIAREGLPVRTLSGGSGIVSLLVRPINTSNINEGTDLIVNAAGEPTPRVGTGSACFCIGRTTQKITGADPSELVFVEAFLHLPAQYRPVGS